MFKSLHRILVLETVIKCHTIFKKRLLHIFEVFDLSTLIVLKIFFPLIMGIEPSFSITEH